MEQELTRRSGIHTIFWIVTEKEKWFFTEESLLNMKHN